MAGFVAASASFLFMAPALGFPAEFPLEARRMTWEEAWAKSSYPSHCEMKDKRPDYIAWDAATESERPLYGSVVDKEDGRAMGFRLDQSAGAGTRYDRLIIDLNQNGDLTDDTPLQGQLIEEEKAAKKTVEMAFDSTRAIGGGAAALFEGLPFYARTNVTGEESLPSASEFDKAFLYVQFLCASILEGQVEMGGAMRRVAFLDSGSNLRCGDPFKLEYWMGGRSGLFHSTIGSDDFLIDLDGSGVLDDAPYEIERLDCGTLISMGERVYTISLVEGKKARVEPWPGPLGFVNLGAKSHVARIETAFGDNTKALTPVSAPVIDGRACLPAGTHRIMSCVLRATDANGTIYAASGSFSYSKNEFKVGRGQTANAKCGAPLKLEIWSPDNVNEVTGSDLTVELSILGAGNEQYRDCTKTDKTCDTLKPGFFIYNADGNFIGGGQLDYG